MLTLQPPCLLGARAPKIMNCLPGPLKGRMLVVPVIDEQKEDHLLDAVVHVAN